MRAFLSIKYHEDHRNRPLIEAMTSAFAGAGIEIICIIRDVEQWGEVRFSPAALMQKTFEVLDDCDLILVDAGEKGVGIGIEAGYAYAKKKPIVTVVPANAEVSETLVGISNVILRYNSLSDLGRLAHDPRFCRLH